VKGLKIKSVKGFILTIRGAAVLRQKVKKKEERITSTQPKGHDEMLTNKPTVYENLVERIL
jgi:hypothetical protein